MDVVLMWGCGENSGGVEKTVGVWRKQWGCGENGGGVERTVGGVVDVVGIWGCK